MLKAKKRRIFDIIQIGNDGDLPSKSFDIVVTVLILVNIFIAIFETFDESVPYLPVLRTLETITVIAFTIEYILRLWTAEYLFPRKDRAKATISYVISFGGIIDLLSFLPFYLPVFFPAGAVAFKMFRVVRILRLFRVNAYYDALNVIADVVKSKRDQLLSSVFVIFILMMASSLCMYSLEHAAQPDIFKNAFSGFWWSVSTLLTVGYGDIYPITLAGRIFGIIITFLGVGMVAIPTGILSAGFVEQYSKFKTMGDYTKDNEIRFIRIVVEEDHMWVGKTVETLGMPSDLSVILIWRDGKPIAPKNSVDIQVGDHVIIGGEASREDEGINLKEMELSEHHPWIGLAISDLDISRQSMIVMIRRDGKTFIPTDHTILEAGDLIIFYSKKARLSATTITV